MANGVIAEEDTRVCFMTAFSHVISTKRNFETILHGSLSPGNLKVAQKIFLDKFHPEDFNCLMKMYVCMYVYFRKRQDRACVWEEEAAEEEETVKRALPWAQSPAVGLLRISLRSRHEHNQESDARPTEPLRGPKDLNSLNQNIMEY